MHAIYNLPIVTKYNCDQKNKIALFSNFPDIFKLIIKHLNYPSLQHTASVSHFWHKTTIETSREQQFTLIKTFSEFLGKSVQKTYPDQAQELFKIGQNSTILNYTNLPSIKASSGEYLDVFINILKSLNDSDLSVLETLSGECLKPKFFETLFEFSKIYRKKELDYAKKQTKYKCHFLALQLLDQGYINQAFKVAKSTENRSYNFLVISVKLCELGQILKAIEAANLITDKPMQIYGLKLIQNACYELKNFFNIEAWEIARLDIGK